MCLLRRSAVAKLLTLQEWASRTYETPPSLESLRRWVRQGRIYPAPELHGRAYMVHPDAVYVDIRRNYIANNSTTATIAPRQSLIERIRAEDQKQAKKRR
ncbi:MAG: excisionase [Klebsiella sp.]|uniref:excisionase n=1 Tax=Klebsiella variicola TaxID=244366 RepID=UPI0028FF599F|nr:excisionase [Klebsiella sp.]MDU2306388.1 excisionase [Klebsiella sp.]HCA9948967.1 excisionase [Klebsiella variicola subsp. variicola]